ncbi:MAG: glycosyltransferase [Salinivirgaceae bacterium]|nr:glycosyltransferase [Salinivirgaceae bacterium]
MAKILIVGTAWPYRGGMAVYNERLALSLVEEGHNVEIETFTLQYPSILFPGKTQLANWEYQGDVEIRRSINSINPFNWLKVGRRIKKIRYDFVIIPFWLPFMGPCFGSIARIIRKNKHSILLSVIHNAKPHEPRIGDKIFTKWFVKSVQGFVVMSNKVLEDLKTFEAFKPIAISPHPLYDNFGTFINKNDALDKIGLSPAFKYVLFFGLIRDYKGLDLLLDAFADQRLKELGVKLIVAGEFYSSSEKYYNQIKALNIEDRVHVFPTFIPDTEVNRYFGACDIVVQPYKNATQSGVTQIAYHFEKPMIVTNVGGLGEIVPHGKVGYVVDVDSKAIANALVDFYTNKTHNGFITGILDEKKKYSWDKMAKTVFKLYESIEKI